MTRPSHAHPAPHGRPPVGPHGRTPVGPLAGSWSAAAAFAALALTLTACAEMAMSDPVACVQHEQCFEGERCILGECLVVPDFSFEVTVTPVQTSGYLAHTFRGADLSHIPEGGPLEFQVPKPAQVSGQVRQGTGRDAPPAQAALAFTSTECLVRPVSFVTETSRDPEHPEDDGRFSLQVVSGVTESDGSLTPLLYDIAAVPPAGECPAEGPCPVPVVQRSVRLWPLEDDALILAFPDRVTRLEGVVVATGEKEPQPRAGVQVQALDPASGQYSAPVVTDEAGRFRLAIAAGEGHATLKLVLKAPDATTPVPTVEHEVEVEHGEAVTDLALEIGDYRSATVAGTLRDAAGDPIGRARLVFTGEVQSGGTYETSVATDLEGRYEARLLQGTYRVRAVPPAESVYGAVERGQYPVDAPELTLDLTSEVLRPRIIGSVARESLGAPAEPPEGGPTPEPVVEATVIAELAPGPDLPGAVRRFETVTDEHGQYVLPVDAGRYRLHFRPLPADDLARTVGPVLTVDPDRDAQLLAAILEPASGIPGKALGAGEARTEALAGARVEVHARKETDTVLLWEGLTGEDGGFTVRLPRSLTVRWEENTLWRPTEP